MKSILYKTFFNKISRIPHRFSTKIKLRKRTINNVNNLFFDYDALKKVIYEALQKHSIILTPVKGEVLEYYYLGNEVKIEIRKTDNEITYVVYEPHIKYTDDIITLFTELYLNSGNPCYTIECIVNVLNNRKDLLRIFLTKPNTILYYYLKLLSGYGALYSLILDPYIEEITGAYKDKIVYVIHRKYNWYGWIKTNIVLEPDAYDQLVLSLARKTNRHISLANPIAEGLTDDGVRIALTYSTEVSRKGSSFTLRKKPKTIWTITKLINEGFLSAQAAAYLWLILELKGSIIIIGGMGSGKTTLLQALLTLVPPSRKVVTIEDTPEIAGTSGLWDPLVVRASLNPRDAIDEYKLLKFALRRRADYIVVGEVRGKEARLLVQASRLGHGILTTFHAEKPESAIERLTAPPISIPKNLLNNIWTIVAMSNTGSLGERKVFEIVEITHKVTIKSIMKYSDREHILEPTNIRDIVDRSVRLPQVIDEETLVDELTNRTIFLSKLVSKGVFSINLLVRELMKYYSIEEEEVKEVASSVKEKSTR